MKLYKVEIFGGIGLLAIFFISVFVIISSFDKMVKNGGLKKQVDEIWSGSTNK